ncbi:MAG: RNA 2',3'-cyclic phosphodiesterase, partial [Longimicrobiales bacterium]|nr:RNA 2',3'-cyclic phosphodiesterase [Longimicrobiales bacterium]
MRLFLALNLPKKERERIHRSARPMRERDLPVRWADLDDFHVTLKFLGEVRQERVEAIAAVMDRVARSTPPFPASVSGFGAFPTIRNPSVVWAGVDATPELRCLKQDLEWGLADLGFEKETRAFHPHLTLGRAVRGRGAGDFRGLDEVMGDLSVDARFVVRYVDLMRSVGGRQ